MINATVRPSLSIKPKWMGIPRPRLRLINEVMSRPGSSITTPRRRRLNECRATTRLEAPNRIFPVLAAAPLAAQGPGHTHDLLVAVAELVTLEQRIGYTFKDKLLALSALRISNAEISIKSEALKVPLEDWRRLALLGDRVLYLTICQAWFESGRSRMQYSLTVPKLVTRSALAEEGLSIHLDRHVLSSRPGASISRDSMGEIFEALIAAIFVDSKSDFSVVQKVLRKIGFGKMQESGSVEGSLMPRPTPARRTQAEPPLQPTPTLAGITNAVEDHQQKVLSVATRSPHVQFPYRAAMFRRNPHILGLFQDLSNIFQRNPVEFIIRKNRKNPEFRIFYSLYQCFEVYEHVVDLCSWFPALQLQYARAFGEQFPTKSVASKRYRALFYSSFNAEERMQPRMMLETPSMYTILNKVFLKATNTWHRVDLKDGTVVELVRRYAYRGESNASLIALGIEEGVRDFIRRKMELPDWYDLPENRDKVIPPWRAVQPVFRPLAETVTPTEDLLKREVFDPATSCPEQLSGSTSEPSTRQEQDDSHLSPLCSFASPASTVASFAVSHDTDSGLLQPDMHPHSFASNRVERNSSKRRVAPNLRSLYFNRSPLSAGQRVARQDKGPCSRTADIGPKHRTTKSMMTNLETDTVRVLDRHLQQRGSPYYSSQWIGDALKYLYWRPHGRDTALTSGLGYVVRPTNLSEYLYRFPGSPLLGGRIVTSDSGFDMTDLSPSNRIVPYSSYSSTNGVLEQENLNTWSTGAELTVAGTTTSTRKQRRKPVLQKPYRGRKMRSTVGPTGQNECGSARSKKQSAVSHGRKTSSRHTHTRDVVRRCNSYTLPPRTHHRPVSPFWQKRSTETDAAANNVPSATQRDTTNSTPPGHAFNQSSDTDDRNQDRGMTGPRKHEPPATPETAFGKPSVTMTGNKVWLDKQAPIIAPTFMSFNPMKRVSFVEKDDTSKDPFAWRNTPAGSARSGESVEEQEKHEERKTDGGNIVRRVVSPIEEPGKYEKRKTGEGNITWREFNYITRGKYL